MSLHALYDFVIHFHTYKNIDLINQGIYQIKSKLYWISNEPKKLFAIPYYFTESKDLENLYQCEEQEIKPHSVINNSVSDNNYEYITKSFIIRYADEEVELDEFVYFRIEIPSSIPKSQIHFICEFELGFSDALSNLGKEMKNGNYLFNTLKFKTIQTQKLEISNEGINYIEMYSHIVFHDSFSSLLNISLHKALIDYKMRIEGLMPFALEQVDNNNNEKSNKDLVTTIKKDTSNNSNGKQKEIIGLISFFLEENEITALLPNKTIDDLYEKYVLNLINAYISLNGKYVKMTNKLIDDSMKGEYANFINNQPLIIFSEDKEEAITLLSEDNWKEAVSKLKNFSLRIKECTKEYIGYRLFQEINFISSQLSHLWHKYIELIRVFPGPVNFILSSEFKVKIKEDLFKFLKKSIVNISDTTNLLLPIESNLQEHNNSLAQEIRQNLIETFYKQVIENEHYKITPDTFPILFEESYVKNCNQNTDQKSFIEFNSVFEASSNLNPKGIGGSSNSHNDFSNINNNLIDFKSDNSLGLHLIVLVHGFQGNSNDMRLIKNEIALINPSCVFLSSISNQEDTESDFFTMGKKLANEVKSYIKEWNDGLIFKKLSFIGHSIGGVIIRACLPHLEEFKSKLWMYVSLSSPHLGYAFSESKIINAGMWVLKKWKGSKSLDQLALSDKGNMKDTCVYKLSQLEGLNWFTNVYLLSSHQDFYAPYDSTRIQLGAKTMENHGRAEAYRTMAYNILSKLSNTNLKRVDVNFVIQEKNLDSFIGRTAHIQFLENTDFMKIFFNNIEDLFK